MGEIDAEKLILAIKSRPALYNKSDSNYYSHKKYKMRMWTEVCRDVYQNWEQLKPQDKVEYGHELQKRWKSLRTCFTREISLQKKERLKRERNEGPFKRRKRYEYYDLMKFLISPEDQNATTNDTGDESSDPLDSEIKAEHFEYQETRNDSRDNLIVETNESTEVPFQQSIFTRNETVEEKILDMLREIKRDEEDEDRQFMLSLVPSFRKLNDKQKFEARIEMLKVLKNISFQDE